MNESFITLKSEIKKPDFTTIAIKSFRPDDLICLILFHQYWIMIYIFAALIHWQVKSPSRRPNDLYVYEPQQEPREGVLYTSNRFKVLIIYWLFKRQFYAMVYSNCSLSVSLWLFVQCFKIALWPSAGIELSSWLSELFYFMPSWLFVFVYRLVFGAWCGIRLYRFLITDHCLSIYFECWHLSRR